MLKLATIVKEKPLLVCPTPPDPYLPSLNHIFAWSTGKRGNPMDHDKNLLVQAEMLALIEGIPSNLLEKHPVQFLMHLDQIREKAVQHHLTALHDLICAFESTLQRALQSGAALVVADSYLGAMRDALECGPVDHTMTEALLAHVALRLGGQP
ncbi:hypothetical protein AB1K62_11835 [Parasphingorhabdus sp. JC815]|uniref:hypothetical protein n=1 Tax=Parasphingorhabdus sp. JC815 TaxID=3232140 RepID=UPI00345B2FFB